jgi:hypothetical protein
LTEWVYLANNFPLQPGAENKKAMRKRNERKGLMHAG